jgi:cytidylate kinase
VARTSEEADVALNVVAISRQFGSGGARVGRAVAKRLGFQYADREILAEAARVLHVETDAVEPLEERVCGFWDNLVSVFGQGTVDTPYTPPSLPIVSETTLFEAERQIVQTLASRGRVVIVGRGAAHVLAGRTDVLRVFLHAPFETRVALAIEEYGLHDREAAETVVRESDEQRAGFVRSLTERDWCDAALYDLSLNTAVTGLDRAVELIVDLFERPATMPAAS